MADQNIVNQQARLQPVKRVYQGKPENQMDPLAVNMPARPRQRRAPPKAPPKSLPKPTQLQGDVPVNQQKTVERSPVLDSCFSVDMTTRGKFAH